MNRNESRSSTLICSSRAVRREIRCVRLGFVTPCCPSFVELLSCTICWASSSQRLRSSVGWSAGTMPWSGASWTNTMVIQILNSSLFNCQTLSGQGVKYNRYVPVLSFRGNNYWWPRSVSTDLPHSSTVELHGVLCWDLYWAVQAQALW